MGRRVAGSNPARAVEFSSDIVIIFRIDNFYNTDAIASRIGLKDSPFQYLATCVKDRSCVNGNLASGRILDRPLFSLRVKGFC